MEKCWIWLGECMVCIGGLVEGCRCFYCLFFFIAFPGRLFVLYLILLSSTILLGCFFSALLVCGYYFLVFDVI